MNLLIKELNGSQCKCYLITCPETRHSILVDPHVDYTDRYIALLAYRHLTLDLLIDTHTHADHLSGTRILKQLLDVPWPGGKPDSMRRNSPELPRHREEPRDEAIFADSELFY